MQENRYLEQEKISKLLLKFSVPCVMGLLISALYNIVDQIFIGNSELGFLGNAATGVSFPILCIATPLALALPAFLETKTPGSGILGILIAAPIADLVSFAVVLVLTVSFFRKLKERESIHDLH